MKLIIGATKSFSRLFQKHLDDIPGKHSSLELQKTAILETTHILRNILKYHFINFKYIFQKLIYESQVQGSTVCRRQEMAWKQIKQ
jgi:hypothetical protein